VLGVLPTVRAELLELEPVRIVAAVLLGDVVAVLALSARQRDLRSNVGGSHCKNLSRRNVIHTIGTCARPSRIAEPDTYVLQ
jgi:hypothetical protein